MIDDGLMMTMILAFCASDPIKKAMILLTTDPAERDAKLVRAALEKKRGDDKDAWVLIEASCASTPDHLIAVRRVYRSLFGCSLEEDVAASSAFQQPLRMVGDKLTTSQENSLAINQSCLPVDRCLIVLLILCSCW
jgi:hypothetical protein